MVHPSPMRVVEPDSEAGAAYETGIIINIRHID
jgi:hypothetical protein